ncbi:late embryogenesis abundant protein 76 [Sesamum indicum]|uniref:Late embryogenesis abundant protein 76 n=1 Tax=Sesamum indicum TaxID=4182 RepID=A0A6I9TJA7_SESIN|nr:late embryogenesis abundant protein 76 [Sesamum indicum]
MTSIAFTTSITKLPTTNKLPFILGRQPTLSLLPIFHGAGRRYGTMATYDEAAEAAKHGRDAAKKGVDAAKRGGQQVKKEATAAADNAGQKMGDMAGKVSSTAQDAAGKVKQTAQDAAGKVKQTAEDAWGSVKDATNKIKDTVVGKAEASADSAKDTIREGAAKVDRTINSKN